MTPGAIVLCGGQSRRMGRPKAWLPFGDEPMLARVVRRVAEVAGPIVVVAAPGQELPGLPSAATVVRDPVEGRGPLQGLAAGLAALPEPVELAFATATDVPFLRPAWVARLVERIGPDDLAMPRVDGYLHPLAALYRRASVLPAVEALLAADRLRPAFLVEAVRARILGPDELRDVDPEFETLRNLNTPEDYRDALRRAGLEVEATRPRIKVELFGVPRLRAGVAEAFVEASTVAEALAELGRACPGLVGPVLVDGALHPAYALSRNGAAFVYDPSTPLAEGDALLLLHLDAGG